MVKRICVPSELIQIGETDEPPTVNVAFEEKFAP
jgi:hypothetical protein